MLACSIRYDDQIGCWYISPRWLRHADYTELELRIQDSICSMGRDFALLVLCRWGWRSAQLRGHILPLPGHRL